MSYKHIYIKRFQMSFLNLDLNLLRVFDEVMAERNLTRAADNLALTQPAVSQSLKRLREALGDELFIRAAHGVRPTPYAESIWPPIRDAMQALQSSLAPTHFDPQSARNNFRLAMADATAATLVASIVRETERLASTVSFRILPLNTRDPRKLLDEGEIDLAVGYFPRAVIALSAPDAPDAIRHQRLYDGEYVVVMRRGHPLEEVELTLDRFCIAHHLLVSFSGRPFGFIDEALTGIGRKRHITMTVNQFFTAGQVVSQSDLLTVLPRHFLEATGLAHDLCVRALPFSVGAVHVEMLWHRRHHRDSAHQWLRQLVEGAAASKFPLPTTRT
jgi:DNA-binding transcriptional LysR family regulator